MFYGMTWNTVWEYVDVDSFWNMSDIAWREN